MSEFLLPFYCSDLPFSMTKYVLFYQGAEYHDHIMSLLMRTESN
jgi:hypothetical protein